MNKSKTITVALVKSSIGCTKMQKANVKGLGLKRIGDQKVLPNTSSVRGMVKKIIHLIRVIE